MNIKAVPFFIDRLINVYFSNFHKRTKSQLSPRTNGYRRGTRKAESFRSAYEMEHEYEFCPREVWYFVFVHVIESNKFRVVYSVFFTCFQGYDRNNAVYSYDTLDEEDVLITF